MNEQALITADNAKILYAMAHPEEIPELLKPIDEAVAQFEADVTTEAGRKEIASFNHKLARSKTTVDGVAKAEVALATAKVKEYNTNRKTFKDAMEVHQKAIKAPLDKWKADRLEFTEQIATVQLAGNEHYDTSEDVTMAIQWLCGVDLNVYPEDMLEDATTVVKCALQKLGSLLETAKKAEADAIELERLKADEVERKAEDAREAVREEARVQANLDSKKAILDAQRAEEQAHMDAEVARVEADRMRLQAIEDAEQAKADALQAQEDAERESQRISEEADQRVKQAEATAKANAKADAEKAKQDELKEVAKREANKAHVSKIKREAYADILKIVTCNAVRENKEIAIAIVQGLAEGSIKNVTINY